MIIARLSRTAAALLAITGFAAAEPFQEVTVGIPVADLAKAEVWYARLLGPGAEILRPYPGVTEFKVAPGVWLQLFEPEGDLVAKHVLRFMVNDIATVQAAHASMGINSGEAIKIPGLVTFSEFSDPDGNLLGLYDLP